MRRARPRHRPKPPLNVSTCFANYTNVPETACGRWAIFLSLQGPNTSRIIQNHRRLPVRSLFVILLVSLATLACLAQDKPLVEISGSYQYDHLRLSADGASASLNLSRGFDGSVNVPVLPWFDVVGDVSRVWKAESYSELGLSCDSYTGCVEGNATVSILTFGAGPQLTYRRNPYAQPFARFILGDAHSSAGVSLSGIGASASTDSFLITSGGGIDIRLIHNLWFRVGADWLHSSKNGVTVNGIRA